MAEIEHYKYLNVKEIENKIAEIHICRPEAMNALNVNLVSELSNAVESLEGNENIACVIVKGEPDYFIAGADVRQMNGLSVKEAYQFSKEMKALHDLIIQSQKPYIAAIQGYCLGGGFEFALACDIRIADDSAKFGLPEINLGLIPGGGGVERLLALTGTSVASQMIMTGERVDSSQAKEYKIVNTVTSDPIEEALSVARSIRSKSQRAITVSKKLLSQRKQRQSAMELEEELHEFSLLFDYPDAFEGMSAFLEKRKPVFRRGN